MQRGSRAAWPSAVPFDGDWLKRVVSSRATVLVSSWGTTEHEACCKLLKRLNCETGNKRYSRYNSDWLTNFHCAGYWSYLLTKWETMIREIVQIFFVEKNFPCEKKKLGLLDEVIFLQRGTYIVVDRQLLFRVTSSRILVSFLFYNSSWYVAKTSATAFPSPSACVRRQNLSQLPLPRACLSLSFSMLPRDRRWRQRGGIATDTTNRDIFNEEKDISFYSMGNEKPRKAMGKRRTAGRTDLPIRRQRGWQTPARLDLLRLDSTLNSLQSLDKKQSAAFLAVRCIGVPRRGFFLSFQPPLFSSTL